MHIKIENSNKFDTFSLTFRDFWSVDQFQRTNKYGGTIHTLYIPTQTHTHTYQHKHITVESLDNFSLFFEHNEHHFHYATFTYWLEKYFENIVRCLEGKILFHLQYYSIYSDVYLFFLFEFFFASFSIYLYAQRHQYCSIFSFSLNQHNFWSILKTFSIFLFLLCKHTLFRMWWYILKCIWGYEKTLRMGKSTIFIDENDWSRGSGIHTVCIGKIPFIFMFTLWR